MLSPLSRVSENNSLCELINVKNEVFKDILNVLNKETMLLFPNFDLTFNLHTHVIFYRLELVISQYQKPDVFFSSKLTYTQKSHTKTDK